MTKKLLLIIFALAGLLTFVPQSCENNNELDLYGTQQCDTTIITWESKISAILQDKCVKCHGEEIANAGVRHDSYESELIVVNDGRLKWRINDPDPSIRMPKNEPALDSCTLLLINLWIERGAPEK